LIFLNERDADAVQALRGQGAHLGAALNRRQAHAGVHRAAVIHRSS
jgi:hypothetical protein